MNNNRSGKQAKSLAANINLFICLFVDAVRTHVVFACNANCSQTELMQRCKLTRNLNGGIKSKLILLFCTTIEPKNASTNKEACNSAAMHCQLVICLPLNDFSLCVRYDHSKYFDVTV